MYAEPQSVTTVRRNFQIQHQKTPLAHTAFLRLVENFDNRGNVESKNGQEKSPAFEQTVQTFSSYSF